MPALTVPPKICTAYPAFDPGKRLISAWTVYLGDGDRRSFGSQPEWNTV